MPKVTTFLTFKNRGKEAVDFYVSIFKNSKVTNSMTAPGDNHLLFASFTLDGQDFMAMDGGETFKFEEGMSLFVDCADQSEVDYFWEKLSAGSDDQGQCGWLKDKFGVSWQIIPRVLGQLMSDPDPKKATAVREAMYKMKKLNAAELQKAHDQA